MNRRVISLLLAALMLLSLTACRRNKEDANTEPLLPGLMLVPEDFDAEFDSGEEEAAVATEETKADKETAATEASAAPTEAKTPEETQPAATEKTEPTEPAETAPAVINMTYEWYCSLSGEQQMAFMETFDSMADFFAWYNAAKEAYERENPNMEIGDGNIDLGEIVGGNG